ncbi:hypothetical protein QBC42DRAFT_257190 [Cladorrhinum samala]|uniref:Uncharacterized protein n=1 Tax=Cladorrhinum samala TaxID=585594 RepID=A0AAV9HAK0_9PEZI|nr:hypothetical protein QBC42DRAFT_257190 [Cladorrhinum samala]
MEPRGPENPEGRTRRNRSREGEGGKGKGEGEGKAENLRLNAGANSNNEVAEKSDKENNKERSEEITEEKRDGLNPDGNLWSGTTRLSSGEPKARRAYGKVIRANINADGVVDWYGDELLYGPGVIAVGGIVNKYRKGGGRAG